MITKVREISKQERLAFCGAEDFSDGTKPRVADLVIDGIESFLVADKNGADVYIGYDDQAIYLKKATEIDVVNLLFSVDELVSREALVRKGFQPLK